MSRWPSTEASEVVHYIKSGNGKIFV